MPHVLLYSLDGREVSSKGAKAQRMNLPFAPLRLCVSIVSATLLSILLLGERAVGDEATSFDELQKQYGDQIHQILKQFCLDCHSTEKQEGELDLQRFTALADVRRDVKAWQKVAEMLDNGEMPPEDSEQPSDAQQKQLRSWVESYLNAEALANAGDPGPIMLRRLSNAEYTYTIQDLTGVESLDPTREFPVDGAAGEGFTNTGSAQGMSPSLVQKYLDAAKDIADHAVLPPAGIRFSQHTSQRDHIDDLLAAIQAFYRQFTEDGGGSAVDLQGIKFDTNQGGVLPIEKYLEATLAERDALASGKKTIEAVASERALSPRYLAALWQALAGDSKDNSSLLIDALRDKWRSAKPEGAPALAAEIAEVQKALWKFNSVGQIGRADGPKSWMEPVTPATLPNVTLPAAPEQAEAAMHQFRELFPAALCYARIVPVDEVVTLTLFYREDDYFKRLMLDDEQIAELDRLWDELYYVSQEPLKLVVALEQITQFATQDRQDLVPQFTALKEPIGQRADKFNKRLVETQPAHLTAAIEFADRAWRRPLTEAEQQSLRDFYQTLREAEIPHEEAIRLTLARTLASPAFLYRHEQPGPGNSPAPVSDIELASRLSYFLWSSLPDAELREAAKANRLTASRRRGRGAVDEADASGLPLNEDSDLVAQMRRLLADPHTRRLAIQFACQWLHVRNFDSDAEKNEKLYPEFAELRDDMYEETVRFFEDMFRHDGSILNILDADHTFVNEALAKHYSIADVSGSQWRRVERVKAHGRGGLLGMATVLASQSGASRTSPILRGNWVYETLLGHRLPRPPAGVPVLPDEPPQGLTDRQLIEQHSSAEACAKCHLKIDPFGFALEQYDAVGRLRPAAADTATTLPEGQTIDGIDGLRNYLLTERRDDVVRQFCRKLLGYALGREVQLSDKPLLDTMMSDLEKNDYRFSVAVEAIVLSDQFRKIRGTE